MSRTKDKVENLEQRFEALETLLGIDYCRSWLCSRITSGPHYHGFSKDSKLGSELNGLSSFIHDVRGAQQRLTQYLGLKEVTQPKKKGIEKIKVIKSKGKK